MPKMSLLALSIVVFFSTVLSAADSTGGSCSATQFYGSTVVGGCSVACQTGKAAHCTDSSTSNPPSCTCGYSTGGVSPTSPSATSCTATNNKQGAAERCSISCPVGTASVCWNIAPALPALACECRASANRGEKMKPRPGDVGPPKN